jgi:uncharacterized protein with GYD domain
MADQVAIKEDPAMPKYITFFVYTGDSAKAMIKHPSDRAAAAKGLVESLGGTLEAFYWMQGKKDGFLIAELPDGVAAAGLAMAVGSTGAIAGIETHQIFDHDEQATIVKRAATALESYKPPTA